MNALAPGSRLLARYELNARVEDRGLGESWSALDRTQRDRLVGVKFLRPVASGDALPDELAATLKSLRVFRNPLSPAILNQGVANGRPFLVHEAVQGESVGTRLDRLRAQGRVEDLVVMRAIFEPVAALIESAHRGALPLIHGALTPGSVIVHERPDGTREVKVLDLGVASFADPPTDGPARSARLLVTPAPEQFHGGSLSVRTDVFSLGALLREFLALPAPEGMTMSPVGAERQREDVPSAVWAVIARATAIDLDARYESVTALRAALVAAWDEPVAARVSEPVKAVAKGGGSLLETVGPTPAGALRDAPSLGAPAARALSAQPEPAVQVGPVFQLPELPAASHPEQAPAVAESAAPVVDPRAWDPSAMYGSDRGKLLKDVAGPSAPGAPVDAAGMLAKMRARAAPTAGMEAFPAPSPPPVYDETVVAQPPAPPAPRPAPTYDETVVAQPPARSNAPVMGYAQPPPQQVYAAPPVYAPQAMVAPSAPTRASSNAGVWIGVIAGLVIGGTAFFALVFWR